MGKPPFQFKWVIILSLFIFPFSLIQSKTIDDELWTAIELKKKITSKLECEIGQQVRMREYFSEFHKTFTDLSLSYTIFSSIKVFGEYRFIVEKDEKKTRLSLGGKIDFKILNFIPSHRMKLQQDTEKGKEPDELELRNKFKIKYPLTNRFTPFASYELFNVQEDESFIADKYRVGIGLEYDLSETHSIGLFYIFEEELNTSEIESTNIFGLKYEIDFL